MFQNFEIFFEFDQINEWFTGLREYSFPEHNDFIKCNSTLIICPASLMDHWALEVERRCERGRLRVHKYHGPNRTKRAKDLVRYDMVITTYQIISRELEEVIKGDEGNEATTVSHLQSLEPRFWKSPHHHTCVALICCDEPFTSVFVGS